MLITLIIVNYLSHFSNELFILTMISIEYDILKNINIGRVNTFADLGYINHLFLLSTLY